MDDLHFSSWTDGLMNLQALINTTAIRGVSWTSRRIERDHRRRHRPSRAIRRVALGTARRTIVSDGGWTRSIYGPWLTDRWDDTTFRFSVVARYGFTFTDLLVRQTEPFVLLDIGANIGIYSLIAASNPCCEMVHSFEPDPNTIPYLQRNLARNAKDRTIIHEAAVSEQAGRAELQIREGHSGLSRIVGEGGPSAQGTGQQVLTIGHEYLNQVLEPTPDARIIVKIDTEGHELQVLRTLAESDFVERIMAIWLEFDTANAAPAPIESLLSDLRLEFSSRHGSETHWDALYTRQMNERNRGI